MKIKPSEKQKVKELVNQLSKSKENNNGQKDKETSKGY